MISTFATSTATILRAGSRDDHGTAIADWSHPSETEISTCIVQPTLGLETLVQRADAIEQRWTLWAPPTTDLRASDRVRYGADVYEVVGAPQLWQASDASSHIQADLRRWEG